MRVIALLMAVALFSTSCTDPVAPPTPTPVLPTITETFNGTLNVGGSNLHPFTVQQIGGIKVTLTSISPPAVVSLGVGTPSASTGTCAVITGLNAVGSTDVQISGTATVAGNFCVSVADPGSLVESVTYTVVVLHS